MAQKIKVTRKKTVITDNIIDQAELLASKAYGITMIADALGVGITTCRNNESLKTAIKRGRSEARQKVINDLMARSENDQSATSSIFLAKQLKVFDDPFTTATPKTLDEAIGRIGDIYQAVAIGELDQEKGDRLVGYIDKLVKAIEVSELEKRLKILEDKANGKQA